MYHSWRTSLLLKRTPLPKRLSCFEPRFVYLIEPRPSATMIIISCKLCSERCTPIVSAMCACFRSGFGLVHGPILFTRLLHIRARRGHVSGRLLRHVQREFAAASGAWIALPKVRVNDDTKAAVSVASRLLPEAVMHTVVATGGVTPLSQVHAVADQRSEVFDCVKTNHRCVHRVVVFGLGARVSCRAFERLPPAHAQRFRTLSGHAHAPATHSSHASTSVLLLFTNVLPATSRFLGTIAFRTLPYSRRRCH